MTTAPSNNAGGATAVASRRFRSGVQSHEEFVTTLTFIPGSGGTPFSQDIPAYGWLRGVWLKIAVTGGTGSAAVYKEDAPWNYIQTISFLDVNSAPIIFQITGHDLYLINKYCGYTFQADPKANPNYSVATTGNLTFILRLPFEVRSRDAFGALANKNNSTAYRILGTIAPTTDVYSTPPTGIPTALTMSVIMDAWWEPSATDLQGRSQDQAPPALGSTQYLSKQQITHNSGAVTQKLTRLGYFIRNVIFVQRNATPIRATATWPDPATIIFEGQNMTIADATLWRLKMQEQFGYSGGNADTVSLTPVTAPTLDNGVFVMPFNIDFGHQPGDEIGNAWLPTTPATRFEVQGNANTAGTLTVMVNDVSTRDDAVVTG